MTNVERCDRCDSKIVTQPSRPIERQGFYRETADSYETADAKLCSMCLDDLWEFVFENDIDRSDKADPIPLERLSSNVERHIDDLEGVLDQLNEVDTDE